MAQIIKERQSVSIPMRELYFHAKGIVGYGGCAFKCTEDGYPIFTNDAQRKTYNEALLNLKGEYDKPVIRHYSIQHTQNAVIRCECGKESELYSHHLGACQCPYCGRWHNLFGQELIDPYFWED